MDTEEKIPTYEVGDVLYHPETDGCSETFYLVKSLTLEGTYGLPAVIVDYEYYRGVSEEWSFVKNDIYLISSLMKRNTRKVA